MLELKKELLNWINKFQNYWENLNETILYRTDCIYTCVRRGFSEQDTWREALGLFEPLLAYADKLPTLDAPEHLHDGHTTKRYIDFVSRE